MSSSSSDAESCRDVATHRTLQAIITSCVATLFACIWVSIHPNCPGRSEGRFAALSRRLKLTLFTLIAPEVLVIWAMRQWSVAKGTSKKFKISLTHAYLVSMGGFAIHTSTGYIPLTRSHLERNPTYWTTTLSAIPEVDIKDRSKGDVFTKAAALIQVGWFIAQCLGRVQAGMPLTELEVATVAFASLNFVLYLVWWSKPLRVEVPIVVEAPSSKSALESSSLDLDLPLRKHGLKDRIVFSYLRIFGFERSGSIPRTSVPVLFSGEHEGESGAALPLLFGAFFATLFGAIHCAAWNFPFPTDLEKAGWHISSLGITIMPVLIGIYVTLTANKHREVAEEFRLADVILHGRIWIIPLWLFNVLYIAARVVLVILPFSTLRFLPPDAFLAVRWASYIPHV